LAAHFADNGVIHYGLPFELVRDGFTVEGTSIGSMTMNYVDTIQNTIEITRQQIIRELQAEIAQCQGELGKMSTRDEADKWGRRLYHKRINRKRQLIASLS
jgi:hypothetical protein